VSRPPRLLLLLGGGGHAAVVADAARTAHLEVIGFLDDDPDAARRAERAGLKRLGALDDLAEIIRTGDPGLMVHAAIGDPALRRRWIDAARAAAPSAAFEPIIHASSVVSPSATIGDGAFIGPLAVVNARASIGEGAIVNSAAVIEHDCVVGPYSHIAPNATLCGGVRIGADCLIGSRAVVRPNEVIEDRATIGAGAVVAMRIPAGATARGVPARLSE
jgi:sugar O-acyltransferase (sialic acid O-acetyltransferase NeuD family)